MTTFPLQPLHGGWKKTFVNNVPLLALHITQCYVYNIPLPLLAEIKNGQPFKANNAFLCRDQAMNTGDSGLPSLL
jgi:hypothetical protein